MPIRLKSIVKLTNKSSSFEQGAEKFITRAVNRAVRIMEKNMKIEATSAFTQRTGNLRRSIIAKESSGIGKEFGKAEVGINPVREGADVNYGIYLEYGTKYIAPRAFIRRGAGKSEKEIQKVFAEEAQTLKSKFKK